MRAAMFRLVIYSFHKNFYFVCFVVVLLVWRYSEPPITTILHLTSSSFSMYTVYTFIDILYIFNVTVCDPFSDMDT